MRSPRSGAGAEAVGGDGDHAFLYGVGSRGLVGRPWVRARTLDGAHAAISSLGRPHRGPDICTEGIRNVLHAMNAPDSPRRLLALTNYGVAESRRRSAYVTASWLLAPGSWLLERAVLRDKEHMEQLIRTRSTTWTLVRAPVLTNGPRMDTYRAATDLRPGFPRADLAAFLLTELERGDHPRLALFMSSGSACTPLWASARPVRRFEMFTSWDSA